MRGDLLGEGIDLAVGVAQVYSSGRSGSRASIRNGRRGSALPRWRRVLSSDTGTGRLLMPAPQRFSAVKAWMSKFTATCGALSISRTAAMKRSA